MTHTTLADRVGMMLTPFGGEEVALKWLLEAQNTIFDVGEKRPMSEIFLLLTSFWSYPYPKFQMHFLKSIKGVRRSSKDVLVLVFGKQSISGVKIGIGAL